MAEYSWLIDDIETLSTYTKDGYTRAVLNQAVKAIRKLSAKVQPVRHGRWVKKHDDVCYWHECSECGINPPKDQWKNEWKSPYCPNCGCRMDLEVDNE